ncbi:MAG: cysteine peptidase family C39 domain-containing protein, partial [Chitinophagaceae bacterium]
MICRFYGRPISLSRIKSKSALTRQGMSLEELSGQAASIGFKALEVTTDFKKLAEAAPLPAIIHWNNDHFAIVYKITAAHVYLADPAKGKIRLSQSQFLAGWIRKRDANIQAGIALLLEPTEAFFHNDSSRKTAPGFAGPFILKYLSRYKRSVGLLVAGLLLGSLIQILLPFLTQAIVDKGIANYDVSFIYIILVVQLALYISATVIEFIRTWIFMHLSTRINVLIISDFLAKLMRLPVSFFDSKIIGDLTQRINDHKRIEQFVTDTLIRSVFSIFTILVFGVILAYFNINIFLIFLVCTAVQL